MSTIVRVDRASGIRLSDVRISYDAGPVLEIPGLELAPDGYTLVTGPSGCGKSTLALALVGVLADMTGATVSGSISVDGVELIGDDSAGPGRVVSAVWQRPEAQLFRPTILEEVRASLDFQLVDADEGNRRARVALGRVGLDHLDERSDPLTLSGGEQQRLALATALVCDAPVLVLDEAASQLDADASARLSAIITQARAERGLTVIAFDHRPDLHLADADRVIVLARDGRVALDGTPAEVYGRNAHRCREIGVRLPAVRSTTSGHARPWPPAPDAPAALSLHQVTVTRRSNAGGGSLLRDVSFELPEGAVALLVGPNGSGKSTLLNLLAGAERRGRNGVRPPRKRRQAQGIGYAPQRGSELMFARTVRAELALACAHQAGRVGAGSGTVLDRLDEMLCWAGLRPQADAHPQHLSGGQRQRLSVLLAVANHPALLLLDEPTNAQDANGAANILDLIRRGAEHRVTVIATHEEALFADLATHRIALRQGHLTQVRAL